MMSIGQVQIASGLLVKREDALGARGGGDGFRQPRA